MRFIIRGIHSLYISRCSEYCGWTLLIVESEKKNLYGLMAGVAFTVHFIALRRYWKEQMELSNWNTAFISCTGQV